LNNGEETIPAELITAITLGEGDRERITVRLQMAASQPLDLTYRVDPNIVAGAMVRLGDMLIDGSLQGQLQQLRTNYEAETE
jgi:F-type H+-transporting ATPase subunit delta